jgi:sec-independent protein translocase protein TatA
MFGLGSQEILLILLILVVLFGAKRLPAIGKGLGETLKEIRNIRGERKAEKEKTKEDQKGGLVSEIKKDFDEIPGVKEAREIKETTDKIKSVTKLLK